MMRRHNVYDRAKERQGGLSGEQQLQSEMGCNLLYSENRLNKVCGYKYLSRLREAIQKEIGIQRATKKKK